MDVATIVIEQPYGTVLVTVDVPVGPIEGQLDSNTGANLVHAEGFGIDGDGIPYFRAGGAAHGEQAALGLSGDGQVSLTRAGIPGGAMALREGTHALVEQPSGPDPTRRARPGSPVHGHERVERTSAEAPHEKPQPGTHSPIPKPKRPLSRLAKRLRRKRTDTK